MLAMIYVLSALILFSQTPHGQILEAGRSVNANSQANDKDELAPLRQRALEIIQQQVIETRNINKVDARVRALLQAADLLWPHREQAARGILAEAFDVAEGHFKEHRGDEVRKGADGLFSKVPDQRLVVIKTIAGLDAEWGKTLASRIVEDLAENDGAPNNSKVDVKNIKDGPPPTRGLADNTSDKLLHLAVESLSENKPYAVTMFKRSLNYPASYGTPLFLLLLAKTDQAQADSLYKEALIANSSGQNSEGIIYLSPYPFALNHVIAPVKMRMFYEPPPTFAANPNLQRQFVDVFLKYTASYIQSATREIKADIVPNEQLPEAGRLYVALANLERILAKRLPALAEQVYNYKTKIDPLLSTNHRTQAERMLPKPSPGNESEFDSVANKASQQSNVDRKDALLTRAIFALGESEDFSRLENLAFKINSRQTRIDTLDFLYFQELQKRLKKGAFEEAANLARKVSASDLRAYSLSDTAAESVKGAKDQTQVPDVLNEAALEAIGAQNTGIKIRALLKLTSLLAKFDKARMLQMGYETAKAINTCESEDLESSLYSAVIRRQIKGEQFSMYIGYRISNNNMDAVFRDLGVASFEEALIIAHRIENAGVRSTANLAVCASILGKETVTPEAKSDLARWRLIILALSLLRLRS